VLGRGAGAAKGVPGGAGAARAAGQAVRCYPGRLIIAILCLILLVYGLIVVTLIMINQKNAG
jgi:hypothetical protein